MVHGAACGKVILLGEHAVVYGVPAIVLGIDRGATASATAIEVHAAAPAGQTEGPSFRNAARRTTARSELALGTTERVTEDGASDVARAFAALLGACAVTRAVRVEVMTELPAGAGLGCSAALAVAIVRALDAWEGRAPATPSDAAERAMAWEKVFHGNPSGVDAAAAARGGCLLYQRMSGGLHLNEISLAAPLALVIGHSGVSSSTREMVEVVAKLKARSEQNVTRSFEAIESLVQNARLAIEAGDHVGLGKLMDLNQVLLSGLMVSTEEIETMCRSAREAGALGAKLTGSGGGGCVVALVKDDPEPVLARWEKEGFRAFATCVASSASRGAERSVTP
jgi:mevalonate kinase